MGKMIEGWDNAPLVKVKTSSVQKHVTFIYPYYENPEFFAKQLYGWHQYPDSLRSQLSAIIVDDCSPNHPAEEVIGLEGKPFPIQLFRIEIDLPWNWIAARNIAMHHAMDEWCVGTDMDHVITREVAEALVWGSHDPNCIYRFGRMEHTGELIHSHPNSWFMTRAMFWKFGGYDESFSGLYGSDGDARRRWVQTAKVHTLRENIIRHERIGDRIKRQLQRLFVIVVKIGSRWF
jgi:hypothetical protein